MANKVKYGLCNVYYAVYDEDNDTYDTPVAWPGAVSLSLDPEGDTTKFRADNCDYWVGVSNNGYSGDFESALIPTSFLTDVMKETYGSTDKIYAEYSNVQPEQFALLFQFEGDESATRYVLYNCKAARPGVAGQTTEETIEPSTTALTITASPRVSDSLVKAYCEDTTATAYANWFTAVQIPS